METSIRPRMTAEEFTTWSAAQPEGLRYELADGEIVSMAPERLRHARIKLRVCRRLEEAIEREDLPCIVFPDGMAVRIDDRTVYEPDAAVRCGDPLPDDSIVYHDPIIVVEVLSPSTSGIDSGNKLLNYLRLPSLRHYLIVSTSRQTVVHHERKVDGEVRTRILASGELRLDPPGIILDVASLFP